MKLIVLTGASLVGKDYLLERLIERNNQSGGVAVVRRSFSDQLREVATSVFPWLPNKQDQDFKNNPYKHEHNDHNLTPRGIWVKLAKCVREIHDSIFADRLIETLQEEINSLAVNNEQKIFVISDLRSPVEYKLTKKLKNYEHIDVTIVRITNPEITKENCAEIDRDTFDFEVDHEFVNYKSLACKERFFMLIDTILQ